MKNKHDEIFKLNFSKKENALELINVILPEPIKNNLDISTLTLENGSYTDSKLKKHFF